MLCSSKAVQSHWIQDPLWYEQAPMTLWVHIPATPPPGHTVTAHTKNTPSHFPRGELFLGINGADKWLILGYAHILSSDERGLRSLAIDYSV